MGQGEENVLDFVPRLSFLPIEWRNIGAAFGLKDRSGPAASGRCSFFVKEGIDAAELSTTGRVVEGSSDVGVALKLSTLAIGLTAGNLSFRSGMDDPTAAIAQRVGEASVPSLKLTAAKQFKGENYVAASYDLKTRRPELSACWTGDATTERATLLVRVDPIMRSVKLAAAVSTPGPEWRKTVYDDVTDRVEDPADDGARHTLYVQHEARGRDLLASTRIGCRLDLGRLANYAADILDYHVEERVPGFLWNIPLLPQLWYLLVPAEDEDQVRHHIRGWELDVCHDFSRGGPRPALALCKSFKYGTLAASYDMATEEAGLSYSRRGLTLGARVGRLEGQGWKKPSLQLSVEPLTLLC
ncbi:hypothetical protein PLESTB_000841200 [Pleodorina starrii]|uniref:Uncharacterized protein n=1 Tax=Pleodorina starrii TaxID=330485 RepID=A0A9W6BLG2_9CHLO|nr:hypothetical protein PLESTM_000157000 [Pleodorina starrii]GLC54264.1 hypothetical protein PLESTB_000841200 [Pleodorina starrii]GLC64435.1 hypothetical protein PLESTF_000165700 [Pleodorina starrii]